jgi:hypothetical protein
VPLGILYTFHPFRPKVKIDRPQLVGEIVLLFFCTNNEFQEKPNLQIEHRSIARFGVSKAEDGNQFVVIKGLQCLSQN